METPFAIVVTTITVIQSPITHLCRVAGIQAKLGTVFRRQMVSMTLDYVTKWASHLQIVTP